MLRSKSSKILNPFSVPVPEPTPAAPTICTEVRGLLVAPFCLKSDLLHFLWNFWLLEKIDQSELENALFSMQFAWNMSNVHTKDVSFTIF